MPRKPMIRRDILLAALLVAVGFTVLGLVLTWTANAQHRAESRELAMRATSPSASSREPAR